MTTETKESVPVLDILRDGGVIEIARLGDDGYSAGLRHNHHTGVWHVETLGASPIGALTALMQREQRVTVAVLTDAEIQLCQAALALSAQLWNGKRDLLFRDMLQSWLDDFAPSTDLLPREVLDHLLTDIALLHAYSAVGGTVYAEGDGRGGRGAEVREAAFQFLKRVVVTVAGHPARMLTVQLSAAREMLRAHKRMPAEITLPLAGAL